MTLLLGRYETHPAADLFPLMDADALKRLAADIKEHGLRDPIVMHDDKVLDGRNRLRACDKAGVEPRFVEWLELLDAAGDDGENPSAVEWVLSRNLHRRHLTDTERKRVAAKVSKIYEAEARERQAAGLKKGDAPVSADLRSREDTGKSTERAARDLGVSVRGVEQAKRVAKAPVLDEAVETGIASLDAAAALADEPEERQRELVAAGSQAIREAAKAKRGGKIKRQEKAKLSPVERFVLRVRIVAEESAKTAEQVRADLQAALDELDAA